MSDSVRPHRRQPTRLPCPWDSPGKNTGVSCHFLLQCMKVKSEREVAQSCLTLSDPMDCSLPGSSVHGILQARVLEWGAIAFSNTGCYRVPKVAGTKAPILQCFVNPCFGHSLISHKLTQVTWLLSKGYIHLLWQRDNAFATNRGALTQASIVRGYII